MQSSRPAIRAPKPSQRRTWRVAVLSAWIAAVCMSAAALSASAADRRVALVIGNGAYAQSPLPNTINDARAMTDVLGRLGFKVITRLNAEVNRGLQFQDVKDKLAAVGAETVGTTPDELGKFVRSESEKFAKLIKASGAKGTD